MSTAIATLKQSVDRCLVELREEIDNAGLKNDGIAIESLAEFIDQQETADKALERAVGTWAVLQRQLDLVQTLVWKGAPGESTNGGHREINPELVSKLAITHMEWIGIDRTKLLIRKYSHGGKLSDVPTDSYRDLCNEMKSELAYAGLITP